MIIIEIIKIVGSIFAGIISAFFKAFITFSELNTIKERIIAAGLGIPFQVVAVASLILTTITISLAIIKKLKCV